jgi:hypothetical protein
MRSMQKPQIIAIVAFVIVLGGLFAVCFLPNHDSTRQTNNAIQPVAPQQAEASKPITPRQATGQRPPTPEEAQYLKSQGIDPKGILVDTSPAATTPSNVHYMITAGTGSTQMVYYSEAEPKPYGNGYKFKAIGYETEVIVSGEIQILKLR